MVKQCPQERRLKGVMLLRKAGTEDTMLATGVGNEPWRLVCPPGRDCDSHSPSTLGNMLG